MSSSHAGKEWSIWAHELLSTIEKLKDLRNKVNQKEFEDNYLYHDTAILNVGNLGEYAKHIPADIQKRYADIPWRDIQDMRNILFHDYPGVDLDAVWGVIENRLDELENQIQNLLKQEGL